MPPNNTLWNTNAQNLSENVPATGIFSNTLDFQLQYLAHPPHVMSCSFKENLENVSQAMHEPPQMISTDDWPLAMVSDQMEYSSFSDSLGVHNEICLTTSMNRGGLK